LAAVVAVAALAVAACSGGDEETAVPAGGTEAPASSTTAPTPTTTSSSTTTVPPTTTAPPTTTTTEPPEPTYRPGASSPEIGLLQLRLVELGFRPGEANGVYGPQTSSAVLAFQKREGIGRDGIAGPETLARLAIPQGAGGQRSGPGPWIEVDLARQIAFVADASGTVTTLNVSTGNGQPYTSSSGATAIARTPTGEWPIYRTYDGTETGFLGTLYRPLYFTGGYAVHGSPSVPAYPASHGCVRVSNADADWLWTFVGHGVPVQVHA
jgi:peptidoglycan hydrolase-like protein with peptidoglycan-binding domain